jgi:hypothetical protein
LNHIPQRGSHERLLIEGQFYLDSFR